MKDALIQLSKGAQKGPAANLIPVLFGEKQPMHSKKVVQFTPFNKNLDHSQECCAAGCRTLAEAKAYTEQKRKRELEASAQKAKEGNQVVASSKVMQKATRPMNREKGESDGSPRNTIDSHKIKGGAGLDSGSKDSLYATIGLVTAKSFDDWDITGLPGTDFLSENEQRLCCQNRLLPSHYLKMQEKLVEEIFKGTIVKKSDAHGLFKVDPVKVDKVYDIVIKKLGQHDESAVV